MSILRKIVEYGNVNGIKKLFFNGDLYDKSASWHRLSERSRTVRGICRGFQGETTVILGNHEEWIDEKIMPIADLVEPPMLFRRGACVINGAVAYHGHHYQGIKASVRHHLMSILSDLYCFDQGNRDFLYSSIIQTALLGHGEELGIPTKIIKNKMPPSLPYLVEQMEKTKTNADPNDYRNERAGWFESSSIWSQLAPIFGRRITITGHMHQPGIRTHRAFTEQKKSMSVVGVDCGSFVNGGCPITAVSVQGNQLSLLEYDQKENQFQPSHSLELRPLYHERIDQPPNPQE